MQVFCFIRSVLKSVVPKELFGSEVNEQQFLKHILVSIQYTYCILIGSQFQIIRKCHCHARSTFVVKALNSLTTALFKSLTIIPIVVS